MYKAMIERLRTYGTAVEITWGEDDDLWTVAWITQGVRFTSQSKALATALDTVWVDAAVYWATDGRVAEPSTTYAG